jgi:hypothetical protein
MFFSANADLRDLDNSRTFDETRTSDHPALAELVQVVVRHCFGGATAKRRKQVVQLVLVLLANLYAAWQDDPGMSIAIPMSNRGYAAKSRYNPLAVSSEMIVVVKEATSHDVISMAKGFLDRGTKISRLTRIWPTPWLEQAFATAQSRFATTRRAERTESLILRSNNKDAVEYADTDETLAMRATLDAYNSRLHRAFIDIPELDAPYIELSSARRLVVSSTDQWVRRIFNRGSWEKGGRFLRWLVAAVPEAVAEAHLHR